MAEEMKNKMYVVYHTNKGEFTVELFPEEAPVTVDNFKKLAEKGFYNGTIFHRIIRDFMIQGGDPEGTGRGGPGYQIPDEFGPGLTHDDEGYFSMANAGPNTGGSQFFITLAPTPWLDGHHAVFGKVVDGIDVVRKIGVAKTDFRDRPVNEISMEKVEVVK